MAAAEIGSVAIAKLLLKDPRVEQTINAVNTLDQQRIQTTAYAAFQGTALHYALRTMHMLAISEDERNNPPGPPGDYLGVIKVLLEAGASPLSGAARASPLALALENGIHVAIDLMLPYAKCGQLELTMLPLHTYPKGYEPVQYGTGIIHSAARAGRIMADRCRELLRSHAKHKDHGLYALSGVSMHQYASIAKGQCDMDGVFKDFFERQGKTTSMIKDRMRQCGINSTAVRVPSRSTWPQWRSIRFRPLVCTYDAPP